MINERGLILAVVTAGVWIAGCTSTPSYQKAKGKPFEDLTLNNLIQWPADQEYLEGAGTGRPSDGEKNVDKRRKASREAAAMEAQRQLIAQLEKMVPREKIRDLLRRAEVGRMDYTYDDGCTLMLRIPKEAVVGKGRSIE